MKPMYRNLRERLIKTEFDAKTQELKIEDLQDALTELQKIKQEELGKQTWSDSNQFRMEELDLQIQLEKFILYKMVHHITHLVKEVEKNK
jgi:uncharacterized coiled-coil protein SlyX